MFLLWVLWFQLPITDKSKLSVPHVDYEVKAALVQFDVQVYGKSRWLRNLKKRDFSLKENHLDVKILRVDSIVLPKNVEFLIDLSTSYHKRLDRTLEICRKMVRDKAPTDRFKVSSFSKIYMEWTDFTADQNVLLEGLDRLSERSSTALYDNISKALNSLSHQKGPKVLIVFSDGRDLMSKTPQDKLLSITKTSGIPIILLFSGVKPDSDAYLLLQQYEFLEKLVKTSRGFWFQAEGGYSGDLQKTLKQISFRYQLSYQPPEPENSSIWRKRKLQVKRHPEYEVFFEKGYQIKP